MTRNLPNCSQLFLFLLFISTNLFAEDGTSLSITNNTKMTMYCEAYAVMLHHSHGGKFCNSGNSEDDHTMRPGQTAKLHITKFDNNSHTCKTTVQCFRGKPQDNWGFAMLENIDEGSHQYTLTKGKLTPK